LAARGGGDVGALWYAELVDIGEGWELLLNWMGVAVMGVGMLRFRFWMGASEEIDMRRGRPAFMKVRDVARNMGVEGVESS
jgi:hypothetical protein